MNNDLHPIHGFLFLLCTVSYKNFILSFNNFRIVEKEGLFVYYSLVETEDKAGSKVQYKTIYYFVTPGLL